MLRSRRYPPPVATLLSAKGPVLPIDLDRQCGVSDGSCANPINCLKHGQSAQGKVKGRSCSYEKLLREYLAQKRAEGGTESGLDVVLEEESTQQKAPEKGKEKEQNGRQEDNTEAVDHQPNDELGHRSDWTAETREPSPEESDRVKIARQPTADPILEVGIEPLERCFRVISHYHTEVEKLGESGEYARPFLHILTNIIKDVDDKARDKFDFEVDKLPKDDHRIASKTWTKFQEEAVWAKIQFLQAVGGMPIEFCGDELKEMIDWMVAIVSQFKRAVDHNELDKESA